MNQIQKAYSAALAAAEIGRKILLDYFGQIKRVSEKNLAGLVSEADVESEKAIIRYLKSQFPDIPVLGEESDYELRLHQPDLSLETYKQQKNLWLIDPLDGTTNYIHQLPYYCVSIGLILDGEPAVGVCDLPSANTVYSAARGQGAFRDGRKLSVSSRQTLEQSLLATGFSQKDRSTKQIEIFGSLIHEVRGIRRIGSAAYDLCLVAEGVFEGYWEKNLSPWDTAAGWVMVREAGGVVTNYFDATFSPFDSSVIAGNPAVHKLLQKRIQDITNL